MMQDNDKRFSHNGNEILQYGEVWTVAYGEHNADVIATALNELHEENQALNLSDNLTGCETQIAKLMEQNKKLEKCKMECYNEMGALIDDNEELKRLLKLADKIICYNAPIETVNEWKKILCEKVIG